MAGPLSRVVLRSRTATTPPPLHARQHGSHLCFRGISKRDSTGTPARASSAAIPLPAASGIIERVKALAFAISSLFVQHARTEGGKSVTDSVVTRDHEDLAHLGRGPQNSNGIERKRQRQPGPRPDRIESASRVLFTGTIAIQLILLD